MVSRTKMKFLVPKLEPRDMTVLVGALFGGVLGGLIEYTWSAYKATVTLHTIKEPYKPSYDIKMKCKNISEIHSITHKNTECMKKKGYTILDHSHSSYFGIPPVAEFRTFKSIAYVSALNKGSTSPETFLADCKECQVHTEVKSYYLRNSDRKKKFDNLYWHKYYEKESSDW